MPCHYENLTFRLRHTAQLRWFYYWTSLKVYQTCRDISQHFFALFLTLCMLLLSVLPFPPPFEDCGKPLCLSHTLSHTYNMHFYTQAVMKHAVFRSNCCSASANASRSWMCGNHNLQFLRLLVSLTGEMNSVGFHPRPINNTKLDLMCSFS